MYGTRLQHSLALADRPLRKLWKRIITKAQYEQQHPKQPPSSTSNVSLDDFDQGVVRRSIASMYSLKKVLSTLDNIRTKLKQSIGYTGSKGRLRKDLLHMKLTYKRCGLNRKVLMERQDVVLSRIRYLRRVRELRVAGYTDGTYVHTSHAVPKCWQDSTTGLKIPFTNGNLGLHYNYYFSSSARQEKPATRVVERARYSMVRWHVRR